MQNYIALKATDILADKLKTKVAISKIRIDFLNHVVIQGLYIEDHAHDTLLYAGEARVRITDWFFLKKGIPVLNYVGLHNTYAYLNRKKNSDEWNYQFIADAFDSGPSTKKKKTKQDFEIDLKKVELENVHFHMDDAWTGNDMNFDIGSFLIMANKLDIKNKHIDLDKIVAGNTNIIFRDYEGGRPPRPKKKKTGIDTTAFNTDKWVIALNKLSLENCLFSNDIGIDAPTKGEFSPEHIYVSSININVTGLSILGDTVKGKIQNLSAKERCGLTVKKLKADVTVSPNASICKNLYIETDKSKLRDYYAMHYERFPDFNDYIHKVIMIASLKDASIDSRDIAYFAPQLKEYPTFLKASGSFYGTVDSISAKNILLADGSNVVKGNLKMIGLPDIDRTFIDYTNGELYTSSAGVFKYVPSLKNNQNINIGSFSHVYFKGSFTGYIDNFATNSILATNLGTLVSDVKLKMPDMRTDNASYSGTVRTTDFNIGALFNQTDLGTLTFHSTISGSSFNPDLAQVKLNAFIDRIEYRGYGYQKITAEGTLSHNKFNGNALVDDPNLSLAFYGDIDLSEKEVKINAKANLLQSDFAALKLTTDSIKLAADFDLNCIGSSIDNFAGSAKLFNINLLRNEHRLDVDSIYALSSTTDGQKSLTVQSNLLYASVQGKYELSSLPYSLQYYVAQYVPNYIKAPEKYAPQDLSFQLETQDIDSLLAVLAPQIKGFNHLSVTGSLNTTKQQLTLNGQVPYGKVGNIRMYNILLKGEGNFDILGINAESDRVVLGDSAASGAISITTTLGNDSLSFNIATNSPDAYGTATINGRAVAKRDSLYISILPSEFYLNKTKWDIPGGQAIFSKRYVFVKDIDMHSASESISINSLSGSPLQEIVVNIKNLDIAELGKLANLSYYEPAGLLSGNIKIDNPLGDIVISPAITATDVRFGPDTLGNVNLTASYDVARNIITLDQQSGIYHGNSSIVASGRIILFDKTSKQTLDGTIQVNNAPLSWLSPLLVGYVSHISGSLDGKIVITGTAENPDIEGKVKMADAAMRIDFLGTTYSIPKATVSVNNNEINLGNITLIDAYKNKAILAGRLIHDRFKNMRLDINMGSSKFEVINLGEQESELFYGNLIAGFQNLSISGRLNDVNINIYKARPAAKSHLYLPIGGSNGLNTYSYVSFKNNDTIKVATRKPKNKLSIEIDAILNNLAEITMVLDPATGDAINAIGTGNIRIEIPSSNSIRMYGNFNIEEGNYAFTLKQLLNFKRRFELNSGSLISFYGPIAQTSLNVEGVYTARARLYDLLSANEKVLITNENERKDATSPQDINILLFMGGSLETPKLSFKLDLPNKRLAGTYAYSKLEALNQDDNRLFSQVASLLLIGSFLPGDNITSLGSNTNTLSTMGDLLSGTASSQLNNLLNKLTGDNSLSLDFKYKNYSYSDNAIGATAPSSQSRSEVSLGVKKYLFNDRLSVQVGSAYDWGKPATGSSSAASNSLAGDFRAEWEIKEGGNLRLNIFRTSNFDALANQNISRGGVGITWRRSFNTFSDFFRGTKYLKRKLDQQQTTDTSNNGTNGTW